MRIIGADRRRGPTLDAARIRLRPLRPADADAIERLAGEWEVARYLARVPHPYPPGEARRWIEALADGDEVALAVERRADRAMIGCCGYTLEPDGTPDIGYWLGRAYWGQGLATEAVGRLLAHLFEDLGKERVSASALPENPASIRLQQRLGFAYAGAVEWDLPARGGKRFLEKRVLDRAQWQAGHAAR